MNPMMVDALGAIIRWALAIGAGYIVKAGIWSEADSSKYVSAAALGLLGLGWSLWQKYKSRGKLLNALSASEPMTEHQIEAVMKAGLPAPSVTTPKSEVPRGTL